MTNFVIKETNKKVKDTFKNKSNPKICVLGLTYKYGVSDIRNSQKIVIFQKLKKKYKQTYGFDPFLIKKIRK